MPSIGQEIITDTTLKVLPDELQFPHETPTIHKKFKKQYSLPSMNNDVPLSMMKGMLEIQFAEKYQPLLVLALLHMPSATLH